MMIVQLGDNCIASGHDKCFDNISSIYNKVVLNNTINSDSGGFFMLFHTATCTCVD